MWHMRRQLPTVTRCAGVMSAYASFAPATTNIWVDNNCICFIDCLTSLFAGFAVFSILGNMAHRQRSIAGESPGLREALCIQNALNLECPADCVLCKGDNWMMLPQAACCGAFEVRNVAAGSFILAFSVRTRNQSTTSTTRRLTCFMKPLFLLKRLCAR
jgi:hypothetical protein